MVREMDARNAGIRGNEERSFLRAVPSGAEPFWSLLLVRRRELRRKAMGRISSALESNAVEHKASILLTNLSGKGCGST